MLTKSAKGASAIYAMTNFWEHIFVHGAEAAAQTDFKQGVNLATAASAISSLEHYIWATLPSAKKSSGGKLSIRARKQAEIGAGRVVRERDLQDCIGLGFDGYP